MEDIAFLNYILSRTTQVSGRHGELHVGIMVVLPKENPLGAPPLQQISISPVLLSTPSGAKYD